MTADRPARFPSGTLVAGLLAGNGVLWAVMFFGTLAHLQALAGGAAPFEANRAARHQAARLQLRRGTRLS